MLQSIESQRVGHDWATELNWTELVKTDIYIPRCHSQLLRWPILCGVCFSLNKTTSYLSLYLSLSPFCDKTSRIWTSSSPEIRCLISVKIPLVQVPFWVLARFESPHMTSSSNLSCMFHLEIEGRFICCPCNKKNVPLQGKDKAICFPGVSVLKNPPANAEVDQEDLLKEEMASHSRILFCLSDTSFFETLIFLFCTTASQLTMLW